MSVGDVTVDDDDTKEKGFYTHSARGEERICHPLNAAESSPKYTFLGSIISLSLIINNPLRHTDVADSTTARSSWKTTNLRLNSGAMENFTSSTIVFQVSFLHTQYSLLAVAVTHPSDSYVIHAGSKPWGCPPLKSSYPVYHTHRERNFWSKRACLLWSLRFAHIYNPSTRRINKSESCIPPFFCSR